MMLCKRTDFSPLALAYLGDAYYETIVREYLVTENNVSISELNRLAKSFVTAGAQAKIARRMLPLLTESEVKVFKSGRNAKNTRHAPGASAIDYRIATGLEALYGYFLLSDLQKRAKELFVSCIQNYEEEKQ